MTVHGRTIPLPRWVLGVIVVAGLVVVRLGSGNGLVHDLATSAAFFCVLMLAAEPTSGTAKFLSHPWLVRLGIFSYSIYLVHAPLVHLAWLGLQPLGLSQDAVFALLTLVALPLIVVVSYGFHRLFERPFMRVKSAPAPAPLAV
jgi:peptidoglycan/LPS O-acetylase OafA/YrhL